VNSKSNDAKHATPAAAQEAAAGQSGPAATAKQAAKQALKPKRFEIKKKGDLPRHPELITDNDEGTIAFTDDPILADGLKNSGFEVVDTRDSKTK
jgi:hypothetical protein